MEQEFIVETQQSGLNDEQKLINYIWNYLKYYVVLYKKIYLKNNNWFEFLLFLHLDWLSLCDNVR